MATTNYEFARGIDYSAIVSTSERVAWAVDEVFHDRRFDTTKRIVPDSCASAGHGVYRDRALCARLRMTNSST